MEAADAIDERRDELRVIRDPADRGAARKTTAASVPRKKNKKARAFWLKQLHTWHWVSAAISLAAMFLFSVTGITLNHAASIGAEPVVTKSEGKLSPDLLGKVHP